MEIKREMEYISEPVSISSIYIKTIGRYSYLK